MEKLSQTHTLYRIRKHKPSGWVGRPDLNKKGQDVHGITDEKKTTTRMNAFANRYLLDLANVHAKLDKDFKKVSLSWDAFRIVHNPRVPEVEKMVSDGKIEASQKLEIFLDHYAEHLRNEPGLMGTAFREQDYPTADEIRAKHMIEVDIALVPDPENDVRAGWTTEMRERYATQLHKQMQEKTAIATLDVTQRIQASIGHVLERVKNYDGKKLGSFNDTLIKNVRDMAGMIPEFNIGNNPEIDAIHQQILRDICTLDPGTLRESANLRSETEKRSQDILDRLGAFGQKNKKND